MKKEINTPLGDKIRGVIDRANGFIGSATDIVRTGKLSWSEGNLRLIDSNASPEDLAKVGIHLSTVRGAKGNLVIEPTPSNILYLIKVRGKGQVPAAAQQILKRHVATHPHSDVAIQFKSEEIQISI